MVVVVVRLLDSLLSSGPSSPDSEGLNSESGHRSEEKMPTCSSWDGKVVSSKEWRFGCKLTADRFPLAGSIKCADGPTALA